MVEGVENLINFKCTWSGLKAGRCKLIFFGNRAIEVFLFQKIN